MLWNFKYAGVLAAHCVQLRNRASMAPWQCLNEATTDVRVWHHPDT